MIRWPDIVVPERKLVRPSWEGESLGVNALCGGGGGVPPFSISRSLIFTAASTQYATSSAFTTPTDAKKLTFFTYFKRASTGARHTIAGGGTLAGNHNGMEFQADNTVLVYDGGGGGTISFSTTNTISDTTSWHTLCLALDTTQATAADRAKVWLDGSLATHAGGGGYPALNSSLRWQVSGGVHTLGRRPADTSFLFNGNLAHTHVVDGLALNPTAFVGIKYAGAFGANGAWYTYFDPTSTTTLGRDDAGGEPGSAAGAYDLTLTNMTTGNSSTDVPA